MGSFESFEKCSILFKLKEDENFNHRGLKFEADVEIGQKGTFFKALVSGG
jgi:hypothetical protein